MDIHKPRPWRGWREFLKEYAIIVVVGVLTALAAEQAVEWAHRQHDIAETRAALRSSVGTNAGIAQDIRQQDICLQGLLDLYVAWADGGPRPGADAADGFLGTLGTSVWDVAKGGRVALLPLEEQLGFARFYSEVENQHGVIERQRAAMDRLYRYTAKPSLSPVDAQALREDVVAMRRLIRAKLGNSEALLDDARRLGVAPRAAPKTEQRVDAFCAAVGKPS
jgi:hypothetical protein